MKRSLIFFGLLTLAIVGLITSALAASQTVTMAVPANLLNAQIIGRSGAAYMPNAAGQITVQNQSDVTAFHSAGFTTVVAGSAAGRLALLAGRNADGSALVASAAAAGNFQISLTPGASETLTGEAAQGNTKTDTTVFEVALPASYVGGANLTVTVNASYSGAGTAGTKTVAAAAYIANDDGTQGSSLVAAAAQTISTSNAPYTFAVSGATLAAGQRLLIKLTTVMQETGATSPLTARINSASVG